ncbi:uncharacterized protein LOC133179913 [Saccostrea echinata]|uniref:uncharacterized protein LOC133179913 n=1 Tax=Saccostrea echinata TaxID=191078 RepID=UPI002A814259|nr:uncharacterized protein LOC133179913 [Saccostrea echinata]
MKTDFGLFQFSLGLDSSVKTYTQCQLNGMVFAVREFAVETSQLIKKRLFTETESEDRGKRRRGHTRSQGHHGDTVCVKYPDNFFQNYFEVFGGMFFLKKGEIPCRSFTCNNRVERNNPDLVYHFFSERKTEEELFFLLEVKEAPVNQGAVDIEKQLGTRVMAQVGAELLGQSMCSVFYPSSLGILCMETKLIFVFLKITLEHSISICKGEIGSSDNPGKIMYTESFDILKAEDRLKMAEFLCWLGSVQDYGKYKFF